MLKNSLHEFISLPSSRLLRSWAGTFLLIITPVVGMAQPLASLNEARHQSPRILRYTPDGEDFVIVNGDRKFNRALYGTHTGFRLETGDVPEFALYLPRMGGNLSFGLTNGKQSIHLNDARQIECRYRPGSRIYTITDPILGTGELKITALALPDADAAIWKIESDNIPGNIQLTWIYGGVADKRFSREGDMGVDPADSFYLKPEYCTGNIYQINDNTFRVTFGQKSKTGERTIYGQFPQGSVLHTDRLPALHGKVSLKKEQYLLLALEPYQNKSPLPLLYSKADEARKQLSGRIRFNTPDPYINTIGGALAVAADGIWDGEVWLHGAVGWRMPLSGWRAAYTGDALGWHDRARTHFNAYAASQVTEVPNTIPHPAQDPGMNLARSVKEWGTPQYSNGYICRNPRRNNQMHHYDMNLCYMDELLWHLNWTGDLEYARTMWPVITRHLTWEKLNYDPNDDGLYDAYACIWASDALYYNSGAVTHSTAYNYRANKMAAEIAEKIGEDPALYRIEAEKILNALNHQLWMPERGHWAEYKDFMGLKRLHPNAGVWTIYHAIDSDVADPFQAYQATRYIDTEIPHIPVRAEGLEDNGYQTISTTNWLPYSWSINNVAFAEVMHTALSYFQAGRKEAGFRLLKSSVLDGMYLGGSPGNFGQVSFYDAARGECYRDFGDPVGVASRMFIQGLFGIVPDAMNGRLHIRPGFPEEWAFAELSTPDIHVTFRKDNFNDIYEVEQQFPTPLHLSLQLPVRYGNIRQVLVNGKSVKWETVYNAIGRPVLSLFIPATDTCEIKIEGSGGPLRTAEVLSSSDYKNGERFSYEFPYETVDVYDPQQVLSNLSRNGKTVSGIVLGLTGHRTLFVRLKQGEVKWWQPVDIHVIEEKSLVTEAFTRVETAGCEPVPMKALLNASVTDIFRNEYLSPRSPYTTLQLPVQGIGEWCHPKTTAEIDDSGLRARIRNGIFETKFGVPFLSFATGNNIAFTSLWDNYPDSIQIPLTGKASRAYLLMAGSTNHMQCHIANGRLRAYYTDGTCTEMELINPENWCPIEQDFFVDDIAFSVKTPRPYRVHLKTGLISNNLEKDLHIGGVYGRPIDGGAGILLEMELDSSKQLSHLILKTLSNDVVIGLMGVTLQR